MSVADCTYRGPGFTSCTCDLDRRLAPEKPTCVCALKYSTRSERVRMTGRASEAVACIFGHKSLDIATLMTRSALRHIICDRTKRGYRLKFKLSRPPAKLLRARTAHNGSSGLVPLALMLSALILSHRNAVSRLPNNLPGAQTSSRSTESI